MAETADRTNQHIVIYKGEEKVVEGKVGENTATITGLSAGTKVAAGDYKLAWSDGTRESSKVDVPAFTVNAAAPAAGSDVSVKATDDGATVTAK